MEDIDTDAVYEFEGKLQKFFPPDDPDSAWLLRLMIIRDDLAFELKNLPLKEDDGVEEVWRNTYFLRRMSVTLLEAASILQHEVGGDIKKPDDPLMQKLAPKLKQVMHTVEKHRATLKRLRDSIGAHVRPKNIDKTLDVERHVLANHPEFGGTVHIDGHQLLQTSFRQLSMAALLFAWPDADDDAKLRKKHDQLRDAIFQTVPDVLDSIDALLQRHWLKHGAIQAPEGFGFGIYNPKTQQYDPIDDP